MSKKIIPFSSNRLKKPDENFFYQPKEYVLRRAPKYIKYSFGNLKPNTRYKVMLDNNPGSQFEDITQWSRPVSECVLCNLLPNDEVRNRKYLKTDYKGDLQFEVRAFGSDAANYSAINTFTPPHLGSPINARLPDYSDYWDNLGARSRDDDKNRERIRIVEYSSFISPESDDTVKTVTVTPPVIPGDVPEPGKDSPTLPAVGTGAEYQTFFIDSKVVKNSDCVDITDVTLYFRKKPRRDINTSGIKNPKVTVKLMNCKEDGTPDTTQILLGGVSSKSWSEIQASPVAQVETIFTFQNPIRVPTDRFYAFVVTIQDSDYVLWSNTKGDLLLVDGDKTETRSSGSTKEHIGDVYPPRSFTKNQLSTTPLGELEWAPDKNKDLKFDVHINQYDLEDQTVDMCLEDYEFLSVTNTTSRWAPGEIVYKQVTPFAGSASIVRAKNELTNDGSVSYISLINGDKLVVTDSTNPENTQVFTVDATIFTPTATKVVVEEASQFSMTGTVQHTVIAECDDYNVISNILRLNNSSVNPTQYAADNSFAFETGDTIVGIESFNSAEIVGVGSLPVSTFRCNFNGSIPPMFDVDTAYNFSVFVDSSNTFSLQTDDNLMFLNAPNHVRGYASEVLSRSLEVKEVGLANNSNKSATFQLNYTYQGDDIKSFCAPEFRTDTLQLTMHRFNVNADNRNEYKSLTYDGETGNAESKMIGKPLQFDEENRAEDLRVIANVHTPPGTAIEFYARVYNTIDGDTFDDKQWTKMLQIGGEGIADDKDIRTSYHEVEYQMPFFPQTEYTAAGEITTVIDSTTVTIDTASANTSQIDDLSQNQVIKLWSTLFPTNYQLYSVESANSASGEIVLQQPISNTNMVGEGFRLDVLEDQNTGFRNPENYEITRYFGYGGQIYDTFDKAAIKIVLLSELPNVVPKVNDYRVIGVSA
jgi:hypothetical protein